MQQHTIYILFTWLHILAACAWVGGMLFLSLVLVPVLRRSADRDQALDLIRRTAGRFKGFAWTLLGILVATGLVLMHFRGFFNTGVDQGALWSGPIGHVMMMKLHLVVLILILAALHDFLAGPKAATLAREAPGSSRALAWRRTASWLGRINLVLVLAVVATAIMLVRGRPW